MKLTLLIAFFFVSCGIQSQVDTREYYFPMPDTAYTEVYKYVVEGEPDLTLYWQVSYDPQKRKMSTIGFDADLQQNDQIVEQISEFGSKLTDYIVYVEFRSNKRIRIVANIERDEVINWNDTTSSTYKVKYLSEYGPMVVTKTRAYEGIEAINWNGQEVDVIRFREDYSILLSAYNEQYNSYQYTFYMRDVGMIKRVATIDKETKIFELIDILSLEAFEALKKID